MGAAPAVSERTLPAHGGSLRDLLAGAPRAAELRREAVTLPSWDLTQRQTWDIELLLNGAFSPLAGFLGEADWRGVCESMRLGNGVLWPVPITLDVTPEFAATLFRGARLALRHPEGMVLAVMTVTDVWEPDRLQEAQAVFGTTDDAHPGVFHLLHQSHPVYVGGPLEGIELPPHHTYPHLRHTPRQLRELFALAGWHRVVGFQTRNPMHRAHVELARRASEQAGARLLLQPAVGRTRPGDVDYFVRVRCYQAVLRQFPAGSAMLSLLPLAMRMAGPREALWHAIIRRNYGCTHFIVGRDHAGPGTNGEGAPFYPPYAAQELTQRHAREVGIEILPFEEMVYVPALDRYLPRSEVPAGARVATISGTQLRHMLREGAVIPGWFSYPEVITALRRAYPARAEQGFTVFFTGLSGAGKSTIANVLMAKLMEIGTRPVTLLDGDIVRKHLSNELGFTRRDRDINIRRIGFVASEITKNGGVAICAPIAPYRTTRREVRELIGQYGGFVEVYVATPLAVCEARDRKGLYAKARAGLIKQFTGIDDPYEPPEAAEVVVDTSSTSAEDAAVQILAHLRAAGYI